jgi:hypothetical protein
MEALRPWLGHLVIVGGWAHRLHRFHPLAKPPAHLPLRTRDVDLAFSIEAPLGGDVRAALEGAGFRGELVGEHAPPVTHYHLGDDDAGFYAEFLTPLHGGGLKRNGQSDATVSSGGITAQKLRYLDLLLISPWVIPVGPEVAVPAAGTVDLRVPNPVSFIVQKLLIHGSRKRDKRAHDVLYIHDTLELFGASLDSLRALWVDQVRPAMSPKTARRAARIGKELFSEVTDTIREAARIPQDRQLLPDRIRAACLYGLDEVLGPIS